MYSKWQLAQKYCKYYFSSSNAKGHGTHSPFIFHFITQILGDKQHYPAYDKVENLRQQLLNDKTVLTIEDFGAGSSVSKTNQRMVSTIAKNSAKPKKFGQLLYRMVKAYQPERILELGTSLGITTSYMALAKSEAKLVTMEGAGEVASIARKNFQALDLHTTLIKEGNFDDTLSSVVDELPTVDFSFIDGNHRREPTERYFKELLKKTHNDSILIFDDIHWSREMEEAWAAIKAHPSVYCTVDLFFIGIVFFRQEFREKQHFSIRF